MILQNLKKTLILKIYLLQSNLIQYSHNLTTIFATLVMSTYFHISEINTHIIFLNAHDIIIITIHLKNQNKEVNHSSKCFRELWKT